MLTFQKAHQLVRCVVSAWLQLNAAALENNRSLGSSLAAMHLPNAPSKDLERITFRANHLFSNQISLHVRRELAAGIETGGSSLGGRRGVTDGGMTTARRASPLQKKTEAQQD